MEPTEPLLQPGPELTPLGKHIEMLRITRGISKQHLARAVGTSRQQLWRVMTGKTELAGSLRARLADALGVDPGALVASYGSDDSAQALVRRLHPAHGGLDQMVLRLAASGDRRTAPPRVETELPSPASLAAYIGSAAAVERTLRSIPGGAEGARVRRALLNALEDAAVEAGVPLPDAFFVLRRRVVNNEL